MKIVDLLNQFAANVREAIGKGLAPLAERLTQLENKFSELPAPQDGKSITVEDVRPMLAELVKSAVDAIERPKDGEDGKSVKPEDVLPELKQHIAELVAAIPKPKDGESVPVEDVRRMVEDAVANIPRPKDGEDGKSVTLEEVLPDLRETALRAIADLPRPKDGEDGKSVELPQVVDAVLENLQHRFGEFLALKDLEFERRLHAAIEKAIERLPKPKDGRNAAAVDSFRMELGDDERTITLSLGAGEDKRSQSITLPVILDRGLFKEAQRYEKGDGVTWGGSFWIAQKDDPIGKPGESDDWRLAVKKGRDAKRDG